MLDRELRRLAFDVLVVLSADPKRRVQDDGMLRDMAAEEVPQRGQVLVAEPIRSLARMNCYTLERLKTPHSPIEFHVTGTEGTINSAV